MPVVYGKTLFSSISDIEQELEYMLSRADTAKVAAALYKYWEIWFPAIHNLITLVNEVGGFAYYFNRPVRFHSNYFTTVQDYVKTDNITTYIENRVLKKRHPITLAVPTAKRDRTKARRATLAFFIHQKDAAIAAHVVDIFLLQHDFPL